MQGYSIHERLSCSEQSNMYSLRHQHSRKYSCNADLCYIILLCEYASWSRGTDCFSTRSFHCPPRSLPEVHSSMVFFRLQRSVPREDVWHVQLESMYDVMTLQQVWSVLVYSDIRGDSIQDQFPL